MRLLVPLLVATFSVVAVHGAPDDDSPRAHGGFTGATPRPHKTPKKTAPDDDDATPAPKKKSKSKTKTSDEDGAKKSKEDEADKPAATPSPQPAATPSPSAKEHAPDATIAPEEIAEFAAQPARVQTLITGALELTKLNLTYTYGSDDPAQGGMDCSGTIFHLLNSQGFKEVPRDSSSQYVWARKGGPFFAVVSKSAESFEFKDLLPGDLLFWTGTYETGREIPISHVMLYLGTEKKTKKRIMFGSTDGRSYNGVQRWGVSVFDFKMPHVDPSNPEKAKVDFVGYGRIPGLRESVIAAAATPPLVTPAATDSTNTSDDPAPTPKPKSTSKKSSKKSHKSSD